MTHVTHIETAEITIRAARADDMGDVARVAGRDTGDLPTGPLLVAKVSDDVRAALSLSDGTHVADPFHRTAELVEMLRIRAEAVNRARNGHHVGQRRRSRHSALTAGRAA